MKKLTLLTVVIFVALLMVACGEKKQEAAANNDKWPEMDEFHDVMADSFHPYMDSSKNLEPAKANATQLAKAAEKWANGPIPEKMNNDETKADLEKLTIDANSFVQIVQSGDSIQIGESLTALHTHFHKIQESWYGGHKDGHKEGEGHKH